MRLRSEPIPPTATTRMRLSHARQVERRPCRMYVSLCVCRRITCEDLYLSLTGAFEMGDQFLSDPKLESLAGL